MYNVQWPIFNVQLTPDLNMEHAERKYDLEDRLVEFAGMVIEVVEKLPKSLAAKHLGHSLTTEHSKRMG